MLTRLLFFYQNFTPFILLSEICNYVCNLTINGDPGRSKCVSPHWCACVLMKKGGNSFEEEGLSVSGIQVLELESQVLVEGVMKFHQTPKRTSQFA